MCFAQRREEPGQNEHPRVHDAVPEGLVAVHVHDEEFQDERGGQHEHDVEELPNGGRDDVRLTQLEDEARGGDARAVLEVLVLPQEVPAVEDLLNPEMRFSKTIQMGHKGALWWVVMNQEHGMILMIFEIDYNSNYTCKSQISWFCILYCS